MNSTVVEIEPERGGRCGLAWLEPADEERVYGLFARLSAESVYRRFFSPVAHPDQFVRLVLRQDRLDRAAAGALEKGELVGVAQYARLAGAAAADLAIVVADAWQRQGIGTRLVAALAERARAHGIERFTVNVHGDNCGARRLLRRVAPRLQLKPNDGVCEGEFAIAGTVTDRDALQLLRAEKPT